MKKKKNNYTWLFLAALITVVFTFFLPLLSGKFFIWFDFINQHIPRNLYIASRLANFNLPQWDTTAYGGCPFLADPENAVFYPFTFFLALAPKSFLALQLLVFLETLFAAVFTFFCVKELNAKNSAALFGALAFVLSTPFICRFMNYGHFTVIIFIPAVIFFLLKWANDKNFIHAIGAGAMLGLAFLGGNPQYMYFLCIVVALHFLSELAFAIKNKSSVKYLIKLFFGYVIIAGVALGLSAVNLVPIAEYFSISQREAGNIAAGTGTPIKNFITLVIPYFFGKVAGAPAPFWGKDGFWNYWEFSQYVGILPLLLALVAPLIIREKRAAFFGLLIIFSWLYAYGENNPLPQMIPFGKSMRIPGKFFIFAGFSFAILSALSLNQILISDDARKKIKKLFLALGILGFLILLYGFFFKAESVPRIPIELIQKTQSKGFIIAGLLIIFSSAIILTFEKWKNIFPKSLLAVPFVILLIVDDFHFNRNFNSSKQDPKKLYANIYQIKKLKNEQDELFFRIDGGPFTFNNLKALYYGLNSMDGFSALISQDVQKLRALRNKNRKIFNLLYGIKYEFKVVPPGKLSLQRIPHFAPKAYIVRKLKLLPKNKIIDYLASTNFNPKAEAVVSVGASIKYPPPKKRDILKIIKYEPEKIVLTASLESPGILILSENALPGWSVFVDGKRQKMLIVNQCFRAVKLDKGKHKIVWKYSTPGLKLGAFISGITLIVVIFFYIQYKHKKHLT